MFDFHRKVRDLWYNRLPVGTFEGDFSLIWTGPGRKFIYVPNHANPLKFIRANGEVIQPEVMQTDAGSVPDLFHFIDGMDPWTFLPGFIIHDWEFGTHPEGKSFKEVNKTLAEAIKTQMVKGYRNTPKPSEPPSTVHTIYCGVNSFVGKKIWNSHSGQS